MKLPAIRIRHVVILTIVIAIALLGIYYLNKLVEFGHPGDNAKPEVPGNKLTSRGSQRVTNQKFIAYLPSDFTLPNDSDDVGMRILQDYGAIFVGSNNVKAPPRCVFANEEEVQAFQQDAKFTSANIGGVRIDLQPAAMEALLAARAEAHSMKLDITPRGGSDAARRNYGDTVRLWYTRVLPALAYWQRRGRLSREEAELLRKMDVKDQVPRVLELERRGIFFSQDLSKSILYSIAAPGTSQHISMLALDVSQFADARVRTILARHGWFQTVYSDLPHFTYLGLAEEALPSRGLRSVKAGSQVFWIPAIAD